MFKKITACDVSQAACSFRGQLRSVTFKSEDLE